MNDYRVKIKVRNNRILKAIESSGGVLGLKWCKANGMCYTSLNDLINMTKSPLTYSGEFTTAATKLCDVLGVLPDDLWSQEQIRPLEKNFTEMEMSYEQLLALNNVGETFYLTDFEKTIDSERLKNKFDELLAGLTERQQQVLNFRFFQEKTLEEVSDILNISKERVRQIETKAVRLLRNPKRLNALSQFIDKEEYNRVVKNRMNFSIMQNESYLIN
jgi:RNA polymerase sigma factor (sigma-70 family)